MTTWPGRWRGTAARTWLREHLRRWAQRVGDGLVWHAARRLEMGHPFGRHDWRILGPGMQGAACGVLRDMAAQKRGKRAEILADFLAWLESVSAEPEGRTPPPEARCPRCETRATGPHSELTCLQRQGSKWERRYRAEAGLPLDGWWRDLGAAPDELVWIATLPAAIDRDEPWCVTVWRDEAAGPWHWDLDWDPQQSPHNERTVASGTAEVAWLAMERALAAWDERPRGKGVPCTDGGGPPQPCDVDAEPCECTACDGGIRAAPAAGGHHD